MLPASGPEPTRILYVCVANVCRSVLAERLTRQRLPAATAVVASAGTHAVPGRPLHPYVRDILDAYGADAAGFASRRLTPALLEPATLVLTATAEVRDATIALLPAALPRVFTIREFGRLSCGAGPAATPLDVTAAAHRQRGRVPYVDPEKDDIPDPAPTRAAFQACADRIAEALVPVVAAVTGAVPARGPV